MFVVGERFNILETRYWILLCVFYGVFFFLVRIFDVRFYLVGGKKSNENELLELYDGRKIGLEVWLYVGSIRS